MSENLIDHGDDEEGATPEERVINEAKKRFRRCEDWESTARKRFVEDVKFANADADNMWQWPNAIRQNRDVDQRPTLTINKTRQHNLQIKNDARQNKPSISVKPVGNEATFESAEVFEGVIRHIEYVSNAQAAYDTATSFQVDGGLGYWRVVTDYAGDDTFDQEIYIRRVKDPLSIYLDPDIKELDGSDARFGFVFDELPRKQFEEMYPDYKDKGTTNVLDADDTWIKEDYVRIAEYFRKIENKDRLIAMTDPQTGVQTIRRESKIPEELLQGVLDDPDTQFREVVENRVERFLIIGDEVAERSVWPGRYIPIVRVIGEETVIEGELDRKGHTRALKDPQRMYNYWSSSAVEMVALQSKSPYIAPVRAVEGLETYWEQINTANPAYVPYNDMDDKGQPIMAPVRQQPPVMASAYMQGMEVASDELRAVSGQYQSEMGAPSNERSGVAIQQRQRQGENATYHFIDHLAVAIRFTGKILIDLIPKIYDTPRIIKILAEDGVERSIKIDPGANQAYLQKQQEQHDKVEGIFNPNVGKYDVEADIGPAFATRRQEAFNAFMQIAGQSPEIMKVAGDLMFKAADFPMADELAERLRKLVPPNLLDEAPSPQVQQMTMQIQQMQGLLQQTMEALAEEKRKHEVDQQKANADSFRAETDRAKVFLDHGMDQQNLALNVAQLVAQMLKTDPTPNGQTAGNGTAQQPAMPQSNGAPQQGGVPMQAPDLMAV